MENSLAISHTQMHPFIRFCRVKPPNTFYEKFFNGQRSYSSNWLQNMFFFNVSNERLCPHRFRNEFKFIGDSQPINAFSSCCKWRVYRWSLFVFISWNIKYVRNCVLIKLITKSNSPQLKTFSFPFVHN